MKAIAALALVGSAIAAPTKTVENRQLSGLGSLPGLGGSSTDSGLSGLASLFPGLGGSSTGSGLGSFASLIPGLGGSSSSSGSSLPGLGGSSTGSSLGSFASLIPGLSGSSSGSSLPGLGSSTSGLPDLSSLLGGSGSSSLPGLTKRASITENGVAQNSGCQELTFIFARGTTEMGNMGSVVGPPVANQLNSLTGNKVTVQGVDYPADAAVSDRPFTLVG
jgi:cutinase